VGLPYATVEDNELMIPLPVIEELIEGLDGGIRAAKIRTTTGKTIIPVTKLFPLEVNETNATTTDDDRHDDDEDNDTFTVDKESVGERLTRTAAVRAHNKVKRWTNLLSVAPEDVTD